MYKIIIISAVLLWFAMLDHNGQKTITFPSKDGLTITADLYETSSSDPYMVCFHQAHSSRGEYKEIAPKLNKLGYNCLAVDLRSGKEVNYVVNRTAELALQQSLSVNYFDAIPDMQAAIEWACNKSHQPVIVMGSSYSASLSLLLALKNPQIRAVISFSPGEYFGKPHFIEDTIANIAIPIFAASTADEFKYVEQLFSKVNKYYLTLFSPSKHKGEHGSSALLSTNPSKDEYWLALLLFINQIKD